MEAVDQDKVEELRKVVSILWDIHTCRLELAEEFLADEQDFIDSSPYPFGWAELYSEPLIHLPFGMLATIDKNGSLIDELKVAPSLFEVEALLDHHFEREAEFKDFGDGVEHTKYMFLCFWFALMKSLESIQVYGRSLNRLIEDVAQGNDEALFLAVNLDHSVTQNSFVSRRIAIAELKSETKFFKQLANKIKSRPKKYSPEKYPIRYLLALTHEIGLLEKLSMEEAYQLFCVELKVYDYKGADPAGSLWRFIQRWKEDNLKSYYST